LILLDTNVVSALMKRLAVPLLSGWLDRQLPTDLWTTSITVFEIRFGLTAMPDGRRRRSLEAEFDAVLSEDLSGRVASLDRPAADAAARLGAKRRSEGKSVELRDTMIAGIALARRAAIATRNVRHFADLDIRIINPWSPAATGR
jgi:toxin FitB